MPRVAGDEPGYTFALCRVSYEDAQRTPEEILAGGKPGKRRVLTPTDDFINLPSASTIIGEVLAKPPSAMAWYGYRIALQELALNHELPAYDWNSKDPEALEEALKSVGALTPNTSLEKAGDRGSNAHEVLELLADGRPAWAAELAAEEEASEGTEYGAAVIAWWDERVQPHIDSGEIDQVLSEVRVWSLEDKYAGTFDLALHWETDFLPGWEVLDLKTHKPASGHTKPGKGPAYISDVTQIRAYRKAFEERGLGETTSQRVIVARDRAYRKKRYLEDRREVPYEFFRLLRQAYDHRLAFEEGAA